MCSLCVSSPGGKETHVGLVLNIDIFKIKKGNKNSDGTTIRGYNFYHLPGSQIVYVVSQSNRCTPDVHSSSVIVVYRMKLNTVSKVEYHSHLDVYCYWPC